MKINKSIEQTIYVLLMLALQEDHEPVKSRVLSQILGVSDSYLKKILMTLSRNHLVISSASKLGGYQLARPITDISLRDVFLALELDQDKFTFKHLSRAIFDDREHVKEGEEKILSTIERGMNAFYDQLDSLKLSQLLHQEAYEKGAIDWAKRVKQRQEND